MKKFLFFTMIVQLIGTEQGVNAVNESTACDFLFAPKFYGGFGLNETFTSSKFSMFREVDRANLPDVSGYTEHKKGNINKLGYNLFVGATFGSDLFISPEFGIHFQHKKHKYDFWDNEDLECPPLDRNGSVISHLNISYGNAYQLLLKFGKVVNDYKLYGILGYENRSVNINYRNNPNHAAFMGETFGADYNKRIGTVVIGCGVSKNLNSSFSLALEYKYKPYSDAKKTKNMITATYHAIGDMNADTTPRIFKASQTQHELTVKFIIDM